MPSNQVMRSARRGSARGRGQSLPGRPLDLLQLHQRAAEILGMQEQHRLVVGADLWFAVADDPRAAGLELVAGGNNIRDLVADIVHAAARVALEAISHRPVPALRR